MSDRERTLAVLAGGDGSQRADGLHGLGLIRLGEGDIEGAAGYFRAALVTQAEHIESWRQLAEIALRQSDVTGAVSHLARVLALDPRDTCARERLAEVLANERALLQNETA